MNVKLYEHDGILLIRYAGPDLGAGASRVRFQLSVKDDHGDWCDRTNLQIGHLADLAEVIMQEYNR